MRQGGQDALTLNFTSGDNKATAVVLGSAGTIGEAQKVTLGELSLEASYGSIERKLNEQAGTYRR